jgi:xanthine dehydrogenase YagS FAD-binding subunit
VKNFDYVLPRTTAEASAAAAKAGAMLKAGGTELLDRVKEGVADPQALVNLLSVSGLAGVSQADGRVVLGALTTLAELAENGALATTAPGVGEAARETATPLVRNRGTLGGNLAQRPRCWYFRNETYDCLKKTGAECFGIPGENKYLAILGNTKCAAVHPSNLATILWALDAKLKIVEAGKPATELAFDGFFTTPEQDVKRENVLLPGQVIESVSFEAAPAKGSAYYEVNEKDSFDWALASCGVRLALDGDRIAEARVVVSAVAPTPLRLAAVEAALKGRPATEATFAAAAETAAAGATPLRDNGYKVQLLKVCVKRALTQAAARARNK